MMGINRGIANVINRGRRQVYIIGGILLLIAAALAFYDFTVAAMSAFYDFSSKLKNETPYYTDNMMYYEMTSMQAVKSLLYAIGLAFSAILAFLKKHDLLKISILLIAVGSLIFVLRTLVPFATIGLKEGDNNISAFISLFGVLIECVFYVLLCIICFLRGKPFLPAMNLTYLIVPVAVFMMNTFASIYLFNVIVETSYVIPVVHTVLFNTIECLASLSLVAVVINGFTYEESLD